MNAYWLNKMQIRLMVVLGLTLTLGVITACTSPPAPVVLPTTTPRLTTTPLPTFTPTLTPSPIPSRTPTPEPTATYDPYANWTVDNLLKRTYGDGGIFISQVMHENIYFIRYLMMYPSDGLAIYGFMNVPKGEGPFPVVIASHGYIEPEVYNTLDYTTRYADDLARRGFLVLHPNLRNYPPSDEGDNIFRVGMAVDILNLVEIVKNTSGENGPLEKADGDAIGLWGHSMGGGVSTRAMVVSPDVRAVLLYGAMSGDERRNYQAIAEWSEGTRGIYESQVSDVDLIRISPIYYLDRIQAAVSIHHGLSDEIVPVSWSQEMCNLLQELGKTVECTFYKNMPHTFWGENDFIFMENAADFFNRYLRKN